MKCFGLTDKGKIREDNQDCFIIEKCEKKYDFVYFSLNINKAADLAIEAFAVAKKSHPEINLLVVGDYDEDFKQHLDDRIKELAITESIVFTGKL